MICESASDDVRPIFIISTNKTKFDYELTFLKTTKESKRYFHV
jgi:hypothetical protein